MEFTVTYKHDRHEVIYFLDISAREILEFCMKCVLHFGNFGIL